MSFISLAFIFFLFIVFNIYWFVKPKERWIVLLISSYIFYGGWNYKYLILILFVTFVTYVSAIFIDSFRDNKTKQDIFLWIPIIVSLGLLFYYKYYNFFLDSVNKAFSIASMDIHFSALKIILPVGISFYSFQAIGYIVDVYCGKVKAERHFGKYATFVVFFPQLVAGPIERTGNLLPQIKTPKNFSYSLAVSGLEKMLWGAWKKVVIADGLARYVDIVFEDISAFSGFSILFAIFAFTVQIYCDFSGYSDIAIGTARLLGIELMENFKVPYFSSSLKEFWRRWHISLSQWFRDYLYIPLGGNREGRIRTMINLMITFLVSGLWHGASFNYILWGGVHGIGQLLEHLIVGKNENRGSRIRTITGTIITFFFCVFAWIFFRAESLGEALMAIRLMSVGLSNPGLYISTGLKELGISAIQLLCVVSSIIVLIIEDYCIYHEKRFFLLNCRTIKWILYWCLSVWVIYAWIFNGSNTFVYFQF